MIREISKIIIIAVLWAFPIVTAFLFGSQWYLLLFLASFVLTIFVLCHYEDLAKLGSPKLTEIKLD